MQNGGKILGLGALAALLLAAGSAEAAPAPSGDVDCHSDDECLGKRFAIPTPSKVSTAVDAVRMSSAAPAGALTGRAWVEKMRKDGLDVITLVTPEFHLVEGAIVLAVRAADADVLVDGGLFRRVG